MAKKKIIIDESKQLQKVLDSFDYSKQHLTGRFSKFQTWMALYNQMPQRKAPFRSNLFIPLVYPIVSTILPRMVSNLPKFRYEPREESDSQQVEQMSTLVDYQLDRMEFFKKLKMWVKDVLIYGTGVVKVYWRVDKDYNDPDLDLVDIFDFYPDPICSEIDDGEFIIHRTISSLKALKEAKTPSGQPLYKNLDLISEKDDSSTTGSNMYSNMYSNNRRMTVGEIGGQPLIGAPYTNSSSKQCEVLEYWGLYDDEEYIITVVNRKHVIRAEPSPYDSRPFVKMHIDPVNHEFYAKGLIEPIEHLQLELNDVRNQRMDNVSLILNKLFVVLKNADVNENELISRPGGVIYEGVPNGVRILDTPDVTSSSYQEEALIKQDAQTAVGVTDIIQGQLQSANEQVPGQVLNKTATGARVAVEQAGSRFKYYLQNIEDALKEFGLKLYQYNQQFLSEEKMIRVEAPNDYEKVQKTGLINKIKDLVGMKPTQAPQFEFKRISPEDVKNLKLDVKVEAGSTQPVEESLKQQKVMNLIGMIAQLPVTTPETFMVLAEKALEAFDATDKQKILQTMQVPHGQGPKASINVSLKGDLNPYQAADIAALAGASPQSSNPQLTTEMMAAQKKDELVKELIKDQGKFNGTGVQNTPKQS